MNNYRLIYYITFICIHICYINANSQTNKYSCLKDAKISVYIQQFLILNYQSSSKLKCLKQCSIDTSCLSCIYRSDNKSNNCELYNSTIISNGTNLVFGSICNKQSNFQIFNFMIHLKLKISISTALLAISSILTSQVSTTITPITTFKSSTTIATSVSTPATSSISSTLTQTTSSSTSTTTILTPISTLTTLTTSSSISSSTLTTLTTSTSTSTALATVLTTTTTTSSLAKGNCKIRPT